MTRKESSPSSDDVIKAVGSARRSRIVSARQHQEEVLGMGGRVDGSYWDPPHHGEFRGDRVRDSRGDRRDGGVDDEEGSG